MCGYVDYSYTPRVSAGKSIVAAGTQFLVRYIGKFPAMKERLVHVRVMRGTGAAKIRPHCPFCRLSMEMVLFVGKRKTLAEDRYACEQGHRISLLRGPNGDMGWK